MYKILESFIRWYKMSLKLPWWVKNILIPWSITLLLASCGKLQWVVWTIQLESLLGFFVIIR